jgi:hypothetical protein
MKELYEAVREFLALPNWENRVGRFPQEQEALGKIAAAFNKIEERRRRRVSKSKKKLTATERRAKEITDPLIRAIRNDLAKINLAKLIPTSKKR